MPTLAEVRRRSRGEITARPCCPRCGSSEGKNPDCAQHAIETHDINRAMRRVGVTKRVGSRPHARKLAKTHVIAVGRKEMADDELMARRATQAKIAQVRREWRFGPWFRQQAGVLPAYLHLDRSKAVRAAATAQRKRQRAERHGWVHDTPTQSAPLSARRSAIRSRVSAWREQREARKGQRVEAPAPSDIKTSRGFARFRRAGAGRRG